MADTHRGDKSHSTINEQELFSNNMPINVTSCGFPLRSSMTLLRHCGSSRLIKVPNRSLLLTTELKEKNLWTQ